MELRPWRLLPDEMRTKEVRKYYNILMKHRMWLKVKRAFDVVVAGIMLAVLIIPMGIIALAIRLDSPGPVFFRQARVTQYGKNLWCALLERYMRRLELRSTESGGRTLYLRTKSGRCMWGFAI